jgi:hypothetical protein
MWPVDVEVVVLHPHRVVEVERTVGELLAESRHSLDAQRHFVFEAVERVAARHGRGIEFQNGAHVQRLFGRFEVQEARVEPRKPLHAADRKSADGPL